MKLYADPSFYEGEYLAGRTSVIDAKSIVFYLRKAQIALKPYILHNVETFSEIPYELKMCQCEVAEIIYKDEKREENTDGVSSESVVGWSKSYESSEQMQAKLQKKLSTCIYSWLCGTGLLYRGVNLC